MNSKRTIFNIVLSLSILCSTLFLMKLASAYGAENYYDDLLDDSGNEKLTSIVGDDLDSLDAIDDFQDIDLNKKSNKKIALAKKSKKNKK